MVGPWQFYSMGMRSLIQFHKGHTSHINNRLSSPYHSSLFRTSCLSAIPQKLSSIRSEVDYLTWMQSRFFHPIEMCGNLHVLHKCHFPRFNPSSSLCHSSITTFANHSTATISFSPSTMTILGLNYSWLRKKECHYLSTKYLPTTCFSLTITVIIYSISNHNFSV